MSYRQEAARVVMGVEQRQLLLAVHRIAGIVDVQRDGGGRDREGAAEDVDQSGRHPRHLKPRGRVLQPAHGRLRTQRAAALRRLAHGQLEQGIGAQGVAVVRILVTARDREHAEGAASPAACGPPATGCATPGCSPASVSARPSRRSAPRNRTSPPSGRDQPAPEIGGHLLAFDGWKIEREKGIFGHGGRGAFVALGEMRLEPNFYPISTGYAMSATTSSRRPE